MPVKYVEKVIGVSSGTQPARMLKLPAQEL
jgi:hypothetical protein